MNGGHDFTHGMCANCRVARVWWEDHGRPPCARMRLSDAVDSGSIAERMHEIMKQEGRTPRPLMEDEK